MIKLQIILLLLVFGYCVCVEYPEDSSSDSWENERKQDNCDGTTPPRPARDLYLVYPNVTDNNDKWNNDAQSLMGESSGESNADRKSNQETNDDEKKLYYPCRRYRYQEECVSRVLANTGQCTKIPKEKQKKIIYREKAVVYHPTSNLTVVLTKSDITGLDGKIEQFHVNKSSGNLVYSAYFKNINVYSKRIYYEFQRQGKEPIVTYDFHNITYFKIHLTAVIPIHNGLSVKESKITTFRDSNELISELGPGLLANPDPVVQTSILAVYANLYTSLQEVFLTEGPNFFIAYLQNYICDFGIKI